MKYSEDPADNFGHRCDALTASGERCKRTNFSLRPNLIAGYGYGRPVRLCREHSRQEERNRREKKVERFPLIGGGFLGPYNQHWYGDTVTSDRVVDWNAPTCGIPAYWWPKDSAQSPGQSRGSVLAAGGDG